MSVRPAIKRKTAPDIRAKNGEPIVMLTSYHAQAISDAGAFSVVVEEEFQQELLKIYESSIIYF
jgi:hypothetical protein